jgi:hypothetical protein
LLNLFQHGVPDFLPVDVVDVLHQIVVRLLQHAALDHVTAVESDRQKGIGGRSSPRMTPFIGVVLE